MQAQHNDFVQINNQRFSIEQFLDILEAQQKYLNKTEADIHNDEDNEYENNFGLVESEVDQVKEDCIQAVLNNFDFETVVSVLNHCCKEHTGHTGHTDYDTELDTAYDFLYRCYDEWKADLDNKFCCQTFVKYHEYYECNIYPEGIVSLKFVPMQSASRVNGSPWN